MEHRWSLSELYTSFEANEFKNDLKKYDELIKNIDEMAEKSTIDTNNAAKKLEEYITITNEFSDLYLRLFAFCELTLSVETKNSDALKYSEIINKKVAELAKASTKFKKWIGSLKNIEAIISTSQILKEHSFYLKEQVTQNKYALNEEEEVIISRMRNTGSNAWSKLQDLITSNLLIDIDINGEKESLPLSVIRSMAFDERKEIRKKAYEAEIAGYSKIEDISAATLNGIKGEVITVDKLRGYGSALEESLIISRLDKESLEAMFKAIDKYLPVFRKYLKKKAEILGYKGGLPFYELFAPVAKINKKYEYDEAKEFVINNFNTFSKKLGDYAKNAFDKNWIDAEPREGKVGGAFCENLHVIGESRIMSNFTGNFSDVVTLAHELGHGYHGACLLNESAINSDYPMPIAETASTFCETIVKKAAIKSSPKEEAFAILETEISDCTQVIVDIYSRFLFEKEVFNRRETSSLSVEEFKEIMLDAQKKSYGDGLDSEYLHPYMWICKSHYYSAEFNFYNYPYAFGLLFSKGLYAKYLEDTNNFAKEYDKLLSVTGKNNIADITKLMGIDIHSLDFWESSLKVVEEDINKFIELA
jgi:pepF/M3 family oligoendopeptidase